MLNENMTEKIMLNNMPDEIIQETMLNMNIFDILNLCKVNRNIKHTCQDQYFWWRYQIISREPYDPQVDYMALSIYNKCVNLKLSDALKKMIKYKIIADKLFNNQQYWTMLLINNIQNINIDNITDFRAKALIEAFEKYKTVNIMKIVKYVCKYSIYNIYFDDNEFWHKVYMQFRISIERGYNEIYNAQKNYRTVTLTFYGCYIIEHYNKTITKYIYRFKCLKQIYLNDNKFWYNIRQRFSPYDENIDYRNMCLLNEYDIIYMWKDPNFNWSDYCAIKHIRPFLDVTDHKLLAKLNYMRITNPIKLWRFAKYLDIVNKDWYYVYVHGEIWRNNHTPTTSWNKKTKYKYKVLKNELFEPNIMVFSKLLRKYKAKISPQDVNKLWYLLAKSNNYTQDYDFHINYKFKVLSHDLHMEHAHDLGYSNIKIYDIRNPHMNIVYKVITPNSVRIYNMLKVYMGFYNNRPAVVFSTKRSYKFVKHNLDYFLSLTEN